MNRFSGILWITIAGWMIISCNRNPLKIDVSGITEEAQVVRFDQELVKEGTHPPFEYLYTLQQAHPEFTDIFSDLIIRIGTLDEEESVTGIHAFLNDTMITSVYQLTTERFSDFEPLKKDLVQAFRHYRHYFPEKPLPVIYTCISGFNESAFVAEGLIGISLDKYLGREVAYYSMLGIPRYKQRKMIPEMIPSDAMYVWAMGEFEMGEQATNLLDHLVHEGKLLYFMKAMMPAMHDTLITGFSASQLDWCRRNETQMWTFLIEKELLYSSKQMDIVRYMNDGPHTNGFPSESPGRTGAWIGLQIIKKYMKRHPEVTLRQMMANTRYQEILNASAYLP